MRKIDKFIGACESFFVSVVNMSKSLINKFQKLTLKYFESDISHI